MTSLTSPDDISADTAERLPVGTRRPGDHMPVDVFSIYQNWSHAEQRELEQLRTTFPEPRFELDLAHLHRRRRRRRTRSHHSSRHMASVTTVERVGERSPLR
jgi:hypothetical protein